MKGFLVCLALGGVLGLVLGISSKVFEVKVDPRIEQVTKLLPGYNCGACGYPGCAGMAEALVNKETAVITCKPIKPDGKQKVIDYLQSTPGPDGSTITVK